jgi:hypothetical protein
LAVMLWKSGWKSSVGLYTEHFISLNSRLQWLTFLKILSFYLYSCSGSNLLWFLLLFTTHQHYFTKWLQFSY